MLVYHGTLDRYAASISTQGILLSRCKPYVDFGKGFYTTPNREFALSTAKFRTYRNNSYENNPHANPAVICLEYNEENNVEFNMLNINGFSNEWKKFILHNRLGSDFFDGKNIVPNNWYGDYDIVKGETCDGNIYQLITNIKNGNIEYNEKSYTHVSTKRVDIWGIQISFHTERSLSCVNPINYDIIEEEG